MNVPIASIGKQYFIIYGYILGAILCFYPHSALRKS